MEQSEALKALRSSAALYWALRQRLRKDSAAQALLDAATGAETPVDAMANIDGVVPMTESWDRVLSMAAPGIEQVMNDAVMAMPVTDRGTVRTVLTSKIHEAFTVAADQLMQRGYLSEQERIALSQEIGKTLRFFNDDIDQSVVDRVVEQIDIRAIAEKARSLTDVSKGGPGSGYHGHAGRPGERGGSQEQSAVGAGQPAGQEAGQGGGPGAAAGAGHGGLPGQVGSAETGAAESVTNAYDSATWQKMDVPARKEAFNALSVAERDRLADPTHSIEAAVKDRLSYIKEDAPNSGDVSADVTARLGQIGDLIVDDSREQIEATCQEYNHVLTNAGVDDQLRHDLVMKSVDYLAVQDNEAYRRTLGDHGINHIRGNIAASMQILNEVPGEDPADQVAAMYTTHIFHDAGYLTPPSQDFLDEDHPRWGMQNYDANVKPMVAQALGDRTAGEVAHYIRTHAETEVDWKSEPIASAVRVGDNLALFKNEKLPGLFRYVPENVGVLEDLASKKINVDKARSDMVANIGKSSLSPKIKEALNHAAREVIPITPKFTLGMLGGSISSFEWAKDHLIVNLRRNAEATRLQKLFDLGQRQFAKFAKTFGVDPAIFEKDLSFDFKNEAGTTVLEGRIVGSAKALISRLEAVVAGGWQRNRLMALIDRATTILGAQDE